MAMRTRIKGFWLDQSGAILVFWGVSLAVLLGMVAISFDVGRMAATQSELQSYADHVALAAAGELDGRSTAITRATAAAANLVTDRQTYGSGAQTLAGAST
jgi:Flp pilus assembly protein TadG